MAPQNRLDMACVCWDGDRVWAGARSILGRRPGPSLLEGASALERAGWLIGAGVGLCLFLGTRGFLPMRWAPGLLIVGAGAALMVVGAWLIDLVRGTSDPSGAFAPEIPSTEP